MLNVAIASPDLERFVDRSIANGTFHTPEEVITAGLTLLQHAGGLALTPDEQAELSAALAVGTDQLDRGQTSNWTAKSMKDRLTRDFGMDKAR